MTISRKKFAFELMKGKSKMRILVSETATKYDPDIHFRPTEESDYLSVALKGVPYATYRTDDPNLMTELLQNGFVDSVGNRWKAFFPYWKEQEGHAVLVPEGVNVTSLADVGVLTFMKTPAEFMKVAKYTNRLFAALPKSRPRLVNGVLKYEEATWGDEVSWNEKDSTAIVLVDGDAPESERELSIRYVDLGSLDVESKAIVDGALIVSAKAVKLLGLSENPKPGMAWRGTFATPRGMGKGHILYKSDIDVDIMIYGPKTILRTERFWFGSMGDLHTSTPHTDRQAFVNFGYHREGLALDLAKAYMRSVILASRDEYALRALFLALTADMTAQELESDGFILRRALRFGVSFLRFPGLYRRVIKFLMTKVLQCEGRARIPMTNVAMYGYVLPDFNAIDVEGNVNLDLAIPEGTIVCPDLPAGTKVVCYRQPSENSNAWVALTVVHKPEYDTLKGRGIVLLGRGAHKVLGRLGGGDMDDSFVIVYDPKWVEAFHTLRPYPETEKLTEDSISEDDESLFDQENPALAEFEFEDELMQELQDSDTVRYTNKHAYWQIDMEKNARAGIGPVVNYGIFDMLLSDPDHKASMLNDLAELEGAEEAYEWLENYEPYQAALYMTNLELVIDGNVKDRTLLRQLGNVSGTIKKAHKNAMVYPVSMVGNALAVRAGQIPESGLITRIPRKRALKGTDFFAARSLFCKCLEDIARLRDVMQQFFVEREWSLVSAADQDLIGRQGSAWEFERELVYRIRGKFRNVGSQEEPVWERIGDELTLMDIWAQGWREANEKNIPIDVAYKSICRQLEDELTGEDDDMMERLAVHLYRETYRRDEYQPVIVESTGKARGFSDGLLWSPVFANHFINALRGGVSRREPFTGYYGAVELDPKFRKALLNTSVSVSVRNHWVYIQDKEDLYSVAVGQVWGKAPHGIFRMDSGIIEFRAPKDLCKPLNVKVVAQRDLTRLFKPVKPEQVEVKEDKPKGVVGQWLKKAIDKLNKL